VWDKQSESVKASHPVLQGVADWLAEVSPPPAIIIRISHPFFSGQGRLRRTRGPFPPGELTVSELLCVLFRRVRERESREREIRATESAERESEGEGERGREREREGGREREIPRALPKRALPKSGKRRIMGMCRARPCRSPACANASALAEEGPCRRGRCRSPTGAVIGNLITAHCHGGAKYLIGPK